MKIVPVDQADRLRAIRERSQNVIVDAGAGTGKTTLLVARLLHLLAPEDDGPALTLERVAAITFTRKAAGELKVRARQALLELAAQDGLSTLRRARVAQAIEKLDNASIGTMHSFADRLLRLRPADAHVSPDYEIAEDTDELATETLESLLEAVRHGTLEALLHGTGAESCAEEAADTLSMYQRAELRTVTEDHEVFQKVGLDQLIRDVIATRDRVLHAPEPRPFDLAHVKRVADELRRDVATLTGSNAGVAALRRLSRAALRLAATSDVAEALRLAIQWTGEAKQLEKKTKGADFQGDEAAWDVRNWVLSGTRGARKTKQERSGGALGEDLVRPLVGYMAERLVRLRPVVLARYEQVKRDRKVLDHLDLMIALRNVLRDSQDAREVYKARFDHVLVDEFQDTDPLQAEIVLYLSEAAASFASFAELVPAPFKLTVVGDPKQSIYRFRRADIATYASVCDRLRAHGATEAKITVNFRSAPSILGWVNTAFDAMLGAAEEGPMYDPSTGSVRNVRLNAGRAALEAKGAHVLPFAQDQKLAVEESRALEGEALARYLRWLVQDSDVLVEDPHTHELRRPRYGDIAVMMIATQTVLPLLWQLDAVNVPHVVRGGTLFMRDPLHQQFVLGLRALSDPNDGVAQAALHRPPFFAVSLADLVRARVQDGAESEAGVLHEARAIISDLRKGRFDASPGEVARRVLEHTGFGAYAAAGPNGAQRLSRLYELCLTLDERARTLGLDFDAVTALARRWLTSPTQLEAPLPVDADAVQIITVHQAKGLEWPIVALWDGKVGVRTYLPQRALTVDATSGEWAIALDGLRHDPTARQIRQRETTLSEKERERVAYVAMTRARDLLIVPQAGQLSKASIPGKLLLSTGKVSTHRIPEYLGAGPAWWESGESATQLPLPALEPGLMAEWGKAAARARTPYLVPKGVSKAVHTVRKGSEGEEEAPKPERKERKARFGSAFGSTVHRALELVLAHRQAPESAVNQAAREHGLAMQLTQARKDVERTLDCLERAGFLHRAFVRALEYPVAGSLASSTLLVGYIDLVLVSEQELIIVDFKSDDPPLGAVQASHGHYVAQVHAYGELLTRAGVVAGRKLRTALLFTGDGKLRWV
jgi:ATP-dependent helicase/nuclease subunit A